MGEGQFTQNGASGGREPYPHLAFILGPMLTRDRALVFQPVDEFHGAVMLNEQSRGDLPNCWLGVFGKTMYRQQQLMLLGLDSMFLSSCLAEMQEASNLPPELGEVPVLLNREVDFRWHIYIVTRYKCRA